MTQYPPPASNAPQPTMNTCRIVAAALIAGVGVFAVIAIVITGNKPPGEPTLMYVAAGFALICLIVSTIVQDIAAKGTIQRMGVSDHGILAAFLQRTIIRAALLAGPAFYALLAYINTAHSWALGIAAGLVGIMILRFPTQGQLDAFAREHRDSASWND